MSRDPKHSHQQSGQQARPSWRNAQFAVTANGFGGFLVEHLDSIRKGRLHVSAFELWDLRVNGRMPHGWEDVDWSGIAEGDLRQLVAEVDRRLEHLAGRGNPDAFQSLVGLLRLAIREQESGLA